MKQHHRKMLFTLNSSFDIILSERTKRICYTLPGHKNSLPEIDENELKEASMQMTSSPKNYLKVLKEVCPLIENEMKFKSDLENGLESNDDSKSYLLYFITFLIVDSLKRKLSNEFMRDLFYLGSKPEDDANNPYVYSINTHHPFSFFYGNGHHYCFNKKGLLIVPAPMFISSEEWMAKPDLTKQGILNGTKIDKNGLVLIDPTEMKKFKGIIGNMIKQLLLMVLGQKISLLVRLFEPKCVTHRITDSWSFANKYLKKGANKWVTPLERMKLVITFSISGLYIPTKQLKPFNPYLGETFQGGFESGPKVYVEHMSHHPLVSRFLIKDKDFIVHGYYDLQVRPEGLGSIINAYEKGPVHVTFPDINEEVTYHMPNIKVLNASSETNRTSQWSGSMGFIDKKNNLRAVVKFGLNKEKEHGIDGCIYQCEFSAGYYFVHEKEVEYEKKVNIFMMQNEINKNTKHKVLAKIKGSWLENLQINDQEYWNINIDIPEWIRPVKSALPSDGRFREDLIWLYRSLNNAKTEEERKRYEDISQEWKIIMEKFQRVEREMRLKNKKK